MTDCPKIRLVYSNSHSNRRANHPIQSSARYILHNTKTSFVLNATSASVFSVYMRKRLYKKRLNSLRLQNTKLKILVNGDF